MPTETLAVASLSIDVLHVLFLVGHPMSAAQIHESLGEDALLSEVHDDLERLLSQGLIQRAAVTRGGVLYRADVGVLLAALHAVFAGGVS